MVQFNNDATIISNQIVSHDYDDCDGEEDNTNFKNKKELFTDNIHNFTKNMYSKFKHTLTNVLSAATTSFCYHIVLPKPKTFTATLLASTFGLLYALCCDKPVLDEVKYYTYAGLQIGIVFDAFMYNILNWTYSITNKILDYSGNDIINNRKNFEKITDSVFELIDKKNK